MKHWAAVLILIAICGLGVVAIVAGLGPVRRASLTTDTHSSEFVNDQAKIPFLRKYLTIHSEIEAAEFHISYRDGSDGWLSFPAPSDCEMKVVMKTSCNNLQNWIADLEATDDDIDLAWGYDLLPQDHRWAIQSRPTIFTRGTTVVAVFDPEGIVFKSVGNFLASPPNAHDEHRTGASFSLQPADATKN